MATFPTRTFNWGNSVALQIPAEFGIAANVPMTIERQGVAFTVRPLRNPAEEKRKLRYLIAALRAIPAPGELGARDPIDVPDRCGL